MLPKEFEGRMKEMLGEEYGDFLSGYEEKTYRSLRINTLKAARESFDAEFLGEGVAWCKDGYYYDEEKQPGRQPYHEAGAYYIQEASAMAPAVYLAAQPGERVLDLCGAPGGKSTQIACHMEGKGLLICNEIHPARARILSENIERMGIRNAVVTNETPQRLEKAFFEYFDRILVDAPCSGEGMFRKNEEAMRKWSLSNVELCARRQEEILTCAVAMLKPGGRLVYSTCTFAPLENEETIGHFLELHKDFSIEKAEKQEGMACGMPEQMKHPRAEIRETIRLWPHKLKGEGHYLAVLKKAPAPERTEEKNKEKKVLDKKLPREKEWEDFCRENLTISLEENYLHFGEQLYLAPQDMPDMKGLRVLRPGLHLGTIKKNRFEPAHALALAVKPEDVKRVIHLRPEDSKIRAYLRGETFEAEGEKGWYLICAGGFGLGWGKLAGGVMKNHYPKGLRKNL